MIVKMLGGALVVISCGSVGFKIAANYKAEENALQELVRILDYMECELQYRLTPLPALCRQVSAAFRTVPAIVFEKLAQEMEAQVSVDVGCCMDVVLSNVKSIPPITEKILAQLGKSIGKFDLEGQLKGLEAVRQECKRNLAMLSENRENRLRSYQTLGLCAGAALAILFV